MPLAAACSKEEQRGNGGWLVPPELMPTPDAHSFFFLKRATHRDDRTGLWWFTSPAALSLMVAPCLTGSGTIGALHHLRQAASPHARHDGAASRARTELLVRASKSGEQACWASAIGRRLGGSKCPWDGPMSTACTAQVHASPLDSANSDGPFVACTACVR